jgi:tetratricopeptide (TPR) repeat protein
LLRARQSEAAERVARQFTARSDCVEGQVLLGRALQQQGQWEAAMNAVSAARRHSDRHPAAILLYVECLLQTDQYQRGVAELETLAREAANNPHLLQDVGRLYSHLNLHAQAERCYELAAGLTPNDPQALYNWATCLIAVGRLDAAEKLLTRVIALAPHDYDAYYNRSTLRRQAAERNHVAEIRRALSRPGLPPNAQVALGYALAKELEDLGQYADSFAALKVAADVRRGLLSYRVEDDVAAMAEIGRAFDAEYFKCPPAEGHADPCPIFIVGLPRSGTTLVDRILSSHPQVQSRGESSDIATAIMRLAGPAPDKQTLIRRAATLNPAELGRSFCARLPDTNAFHLIDKTPINFLYLGMIARALPQARLIHVRRGPVDVCYAMYKTLFRMAYPFSYELSDLARYFLSYTALMQHWRTLLGARLIEIEYEKLVGNQEQTTRELLAACDLPWDEACLDFHRNRSPSLTASASQIRQPIYKSSVGLWRHYARELQPLIEGLRAGAVVIE